MSENKFRKQFDILKEIALLSASGKSATNTARNALEMTAAAMDLTAAALILWDAKYKTTLSASYSESKTEEDILSKIEEGLFSDLRKDRQLISAYMSFGGEKPVSAFTLPIKRGSEVFGAVIGVQPGDRSLAREDEFFEALSASLSLAIQIGQLETILEKERFNAVMATATAINHGINNPLQAVLGIVQLLPKEMPDLDERLVKKLKIIEESALAITKITHKLMHLRKIKFTDYIDGTRMLDLPDEDDS